jgi:hypothetical protein
VKATRLFSGVRRTWKYRSQWLSYSRGSPLPLYLGNSNLCDV